jgi:transcriptional regulator with XRE-family HTH domain
MNTSPLPWQILLQNIIRSPAERQRLSSILGVTSMTLSRWANGESNPQRPHLLHLIQAVYPHFRQPLLAALEQSYPDLQTWLAEETTQITSEFFAQVLSVRTLTSDTLRSWRICEMVLKESLIQLDPNHLGMAVKLVQCMPPDAAEGKVRSLRERAGKGSSPWTTDLENDVLFLGLESMCGYAVEVRHGVSDPDLRKSTTFPTYKDGYEISAAAQPIRFENRLVGCLLASSTQVGYFSPPRLELLAAFSDLIALAFDKKEFYSPQCIELRALPTPKTQRPILSSFRQRMMERMINQRQYASNSALEIAIWQEIEAELLSLHDPLA